MAELFHSNINNYRSFSIVFWVKNWIPVHTKMKTMPWPMWIIVIFCSSLPAKTRTVREGE
jgi:hypothetical protein